MRPLPVQPLPVRQLPVRWLPVHQLSVHWLLSFNYSGGWTHKNVQFDHKNQENRIKCEMHENEILGVWERNEKFGVHSQYNDQLANSLKENFNNRAKKRTKKACTQTTIIK
jgi:hypothetical protein